MYGWAMLLEPKFLGCINNQILLRLVLRHTQEDTQEDTQELLYDSQ